MKKHSHMNGYLAFCELLDAGLLFLGTEGALTLVLELVASPDCINRFPPSPVFAELSTLAVFWSNHSDTSSDDACKAVNPLIKVYQQKRYLSVSRSKG